MNNENYNTFNFSRFTLLEELTIGDYSFENVNEFVIDGLNELNSLMIGMNSFTKKRNSWGNDVNRSFVISNCVELKSIEIGSYSFSDYGGEFELFNLPKLLVIKVDSWSFYYSSLEIQSIIDDIANE